MLSTKRHSIGSRKRRASLMKSLKKHIARAIHGPRRFFPESQTHLICRSDKKLRQLCSGQICPMGASLQSSTLEYDVLPELPLAGVTFIANAMRSSD